MAMRVKISGMQAAVAALVVAAAILPARPVQAQAEQAESAPHIMRPQNAQDRGVAAFERGDFAQAEREFIAALKQARARKAGPDDMIIAVGNLALTRQRRQSWAAAEPLLEERLRLERARSGDTSAATLEVMGNLGEARMHLNRPDAVPLFIQVMQAKRAAGRMDEAALAATLLSYAYSQSYRFTEAAHAVGTALDYARASGDPLSIVSARTAEADRLSAAGRYAEAEAALLALQADLPPLDAEIDASIRRRLMVSVGQVRQQQGRFSEAADSLNAAIQALEGAGDDTSLAGALNDLGIVRGFQGRLEDSEALYRRAVELEPAEAQRAAYQSNLGWNLHQQGRHTEAEPLLRRAAQTYDRVYGRRNVDAASAWTNLAGELQSQGRDAEAVPIFRDALSRYEATVGRGYPTVGWTLNALARSLKATGRADEAEPLLREAVEITGRGRLPGHPDLVLQSGDLAALLVDTGRPSEALPLLRATGEAVLARTGAQAVTGAETDARRALDRDRRIFRLQVEAAWTFAGG